MIELNNFYISESVDFMKKNIPDNFVDLTVTSPPYDKLRKYKGFAFDFKSIANELFRITKNGGVVIWVVGDGTTKGSETGTSFKQALYFKEIGFNLHDTMIYKTDKMPLNHNRYEQEFEYMFVLSKGKPKTFNPIFVECTQANKKHSKATFRQDGDNLSSLHNLGTVKSHKIKGNIWYIVSGFQKTTKDKIAYKHPAVFPDKLAQDHILSWSNENDIIFDPMCGAGTTCKMAYLNNRKFIGIDISEEYINEICIPRLKQYNLKGENMENNNIKVGDRFIIDTNICDDIELLEWYYEQEDKILVAKTIECDVNGIWVKSCDFRIDMNEIILKGDQNEKV